MFTTTYKKIGIFAFSISLLFNNNTFSIVTGFSGDTLVCVDKLVNEKTKKEEYKYKAIKDLKMDEKVLSYDPKTKRYFSDKITSTSEMVLPKNYIELMYKKRNFSSKVVKLAQDTSFLCLKRNSYDETISIKAEQIDEEFDHIVSLSPIHVLHLDKTSVENLEDRHFYNIVLEKKQGYLITQENIVVMHEAGNKSFLNEIKKTVINKLKEGINSLE